VVEECSGKSNLRKLPREIGIILTQKTILSLKQRGEKVTGPTTFWPAGNATVKKTAECQQEGSGSGFDNFS